jgi:WD40 repeat protein
LVFDAFISYSHAADGQLAPALQRAIERLARPWYRSRALRVFRDESALSANPHLWLSIQTALNESEWFVLLASPDAVASDWVTRELDQWLATKSPDRILVVLTDGTWGWEPNARASIGSAVPGPMQHAFSEEPRLLDLRWARSETDLDLRNSRFRDAVAQLAAPVHGIAKDELESEDIRLHRRARRLARGGTSVLVLLLVLAVFLGGVALQQRGSAQHQASLARRETDAARRAATGSLARGLAAESLNALHDGQPDVAQLLAVEAYRTEPSVYSRSSLLQTAVDQPALAVQLHGLTNGPDTIALSVDGGIVAAESGSEIRLWDRRSGQLLARPPKGLGAGSLTFADRGRLLLSNLYNPSGRLGIWDVSRGRLLKSLPVSFPWAVSADTKTAAEFDASSGLLELFDLETGESLRSIRTGQTGPLAMSADGTTVTALSTATAPASHQVVVGVRAWTVATGREIGPGCSATSAESPLSPSILVDDVTVAIVTADPFSTSATRGDVLRCDLPTGSVTSRAFALHSDQQVGGISPEAGVVALRSSDGTIQLDDPTTGNVIDGSIDAPLTERMALPTVAFSADGRWFTATGSGGDVRVWRTGSDSPLGQQLDLGSNFEPRHDLHQTPAGQVIGITHNGDVVDVDTHQPLGRIPDASLTTVSPDGHLLAGTGSGGLVVVDLRRHTSAAISADRLACKQPDAIGIAPDDKTLVLSCIATVAPSVGGSGSNARELVQTVDISSSPWRPSRPIEAPVWAGVLTFSPDGHVLAAGAGGGAGAGLQLFDVRGTRLRPRATLAGYGNDVAFRPDSRGLFWSHDGRIDLVSLARTAVRVTAFAPPTGNPSSSISLSRDGSLLAASDGNQIRLWDTNTRLVLGDILGPSNPSCCTTLALSSQSVTAIGGTPNFTNAANGDLILIRFDFDPNDLTRHACTRANRNLTRTEWTQFIGPSRYHRQCPNLP